ncbi:MAG: phage tail protein [Xanthobacteraceae bacterium]|jgi:phage tail sheath protein FI|nr:phage tail protein [Xanthobacteraceae bacterium]
MATYRQRSTPGVYITELDAFPNSVVGVQTAIPAFIGYTKTAELSGKPIYFMPVKISSLASYEQIFGGPFHPTYSLMEVSGDAARKTQGLTHDEDDDASDNYDFSCMRLTSASLHEWRKEYYKFSRINKKPSESVAVDALDTDDAELSQFNLYNALRLFYANGGGTCYIVSVGTYFDGDQTVEVSYNSLKKGLDAIKEQSGPTMLVIPDAVLLPPSGVIDNVPVCAQFEDLCRDMLQQCAELQDRVAILDIYGADALNQQNADWEINMEHLIANFQAGIHDNFLNYGMAYFPFLVTSLIQPGEIDYTSINIGEPGQYDLLQGILDDQADILYPGPQQERQRNAVKGYIADMNPNVVKKPGDVTRLNQNLVAAIPLLKQMEDVMALKMSLMPPSAAMAGVYTFTDSTRGVWNAPANVPLSSVITPNVKLNSEQQGSLNIPLNGKAINVIRQFVGRGPVVWGARTLDGNSGDWRYIQVRRTLIYVEQSIEAALQPFVFAANDGKTWVAVTSMVSNFLQGVWSQGGLMGAKADEAFTVSCGLGSTMTPMDVIDGYMIVQVTLQMIRPAEFIELTFKQKMQGLG